MGERSKSFDDRLLDLHLNRLSAEETEQVEQEVAGAPETAGRSRALRDLLKLLDANEVQPPANLADRILAHVERRERAIPFSRERERTAARSGDRVAGRGYSFGWRDLAAAAACLVLFFSVAIPGFNKARSVSQRTRCLDNQQMISSAMTSYGQANAGYLPYSGYIPGASWLPTNDPQVPFASNTQHVFRLIKQGYLPNVQVFICPADRNGRPLTARDLQALQDFAHRNNNSYSFLFMNRPQGVRLESLQSGPGRQTVVIADRNPLLPPSGVPTTMPVQAVSANSMLHDRGAGQNAIYADGYSGFFTRPTIGVDADDIYRVGSFNSYKGTEAPLAPTDTFLPP
ncbi:MAG TPA: hypothetical protein VLM89_11870 [Phycisphaerae bacterium]|nr:hypothetical protein [Phycisphaerae bacterium]